MRYSATSYTRSGVADWLAQRVSAYILAAYFVVIVGYLLCNPGLEYAQWKGFMSCTAMQIFSLLALLALVTLVLKTFVEWNVQQNIAAAQHEAVE